VTLVLDSTALLASVVPGPARDIVAAAIAVDRLRAMSALALPEALAALDRLTDDPWDRRTGEDGIRSLGDYLATVPIDRRCLDEAARLSRSQPIGIPHAIHLAAAARLPGPVTFLTFDAGQIPVAMSLGLAVESL
jgi:predicted nucleic acid-binding protein